MIFYFILIFFYFIKVPDPLDGKTCDFEDECTALFNAKWLDPCNSVIDNTEAIANCQVDLCFADLGAESEMKRKFMSAFIEKCAKNIPGDPTVCSWTKLSGMGDSCGENQFFDACAMPCDVESCNDDLTCDNSEAVGICRCNEGRVSTSFL